MISDAVGAIARLVTGAIVGSAVDTAEEVLPRLGRGHPRALRFARLVGGAFLVLGGVFEAVLSIVVFGHVAITGDFADRLVTPILLLPLAMGVGLTLWGIGMMRRGWASRHSVEARTPPLDPDPSAPRAGAEQPVWLRPDDAPPGSATSTWLKVVAAILLWVAGSVLALVAGLPDALAFWLGGLLPLAVFVVPRLPRGARALKRWPGPRRFRR